MNVYDKHRHPMDEFRLPSEEINSISYKDNNTKTIGHRGFLSMIWNMIKANKCAKRSNASFEITTKFPLKWFK